MIGTGVMIFLILNNDSVNISVFESQFLVMASALESIATFDEISHLLIELFMPK